MSLRRLLASRRRLLICGAVLMIAAAVLGGWRIAARNSGPAAAAPVSGAAASRPSVAPPASGTQSWRRPADRRVAARRTHGETPYAVPTRTLVATIRRQGAPGSATPGSPPIRQVPGQWWQASSVLPVIDRRPGWVEVQLAQRPNGSVAWVRSAEVTLATDPYYIVVDLGARRVHLYEHGKEVATFPAGIGVSSAPTPPGRFFVALFARAPTPAYGAFVIVTSAHSNVISDWQESGDAITAIHGPLGSDAAIGTTGAAVSNGCIRLHNADLAKLRPVPAGTPIDIVN